METLSGTFRKRQRHRFANNVAMPDQRVMGIRTTERAERDWLPFFRASCESCAIFVED